MIIHENYYIVLLTKIASSICVLIYRFLQQAVFVRNTVGDILKMKQQPVVSATKFCSVSSIFITGPLDISIKIHLSCQVKT